MIIPNYNQGKFLNDSLAALIGDKKIGEIIVIDDASFDDSVEIISKFKEVKLIQNKRRLGVSGAINAGLEATESEYVMLQGADDISLPGRAEIQEEAIRNSKFSAIVFSQNVVNEKLEKFSSPLFQFDYEMNQKGDLFEPLFFSGNFLCAPAAVFNRERLKKYGYFKTNLLQLQDFYLWLQMSLKHDLALDNRKVVDYRVHQSNMSLNVNLLTRQRINLEKEFVYLDIFDYLLSQETEVVKSLVGYTPNGNQKRIKLISIYISHIDPIVKRTGFKIINQYILNGTLTSLDLAQLGLTEMDLILYNGSP